MTSLLDWPSSSHAGGGSILVNTSKPTQYENAASARRSGSSKPRQAMRDATTPRARRTRTTANANSSGTTIGREQASPNSPSADFFSRQRARSQSSSSFSSEAEAEAEVEDPEHVPWPTQPPKRSPRGHASTQSVENWLQTSESGPSARSRSRTTASPSTDSFGWDEHSYPAPSLRVSASSTLSHFDTPPLTPTDESYHNHMHIYQHRSSVVMSAPIADVGTMDALVDGMNGLDEITDVFSASYSSKRRTSRSSFKKSMFSEPPLPTPPPGVILTGGRTRSRKASLRAEDSEDDMGTSVGDASLPRKSRTRPKPPQRSNSTSTVTSSSPSHTFTRSTPIDYSSYEPPPSIDEIIRKHTGTKAKPITPSISDIIRKHTPPSRGRKTPQLSRAPSFIGSINHGAVPEERDDGLIAVQESADLVSRSSMDSIADEVNRSLIMHEQKNTPTPSRAQSIGRTRTLSIYSDGMRSIGSGSNNVRVPSIFSASSPQAEDDYEEDYGTVATSVPAIDPVVSFLRSTRITTLLKLTRTPHASPSHPLTISLCDLGDENGFPLVVFLGLGCVRHVMGLYDEMAQLLGLRIIAVDRWGLGRTDTPHEKQSRGIPEWSSVMEEVLDQMGIGRFSIMAHSAGGPYALSFANRMADRVQGEICLLAPWVGGGENSGYKWLKYVPNGILKTAQAADWRLQAWMIGKPPKVAFQGIGFDVNAPVISSPQPHPSTDMRPREPRPSVGSGGFSDYDDLCDFDGRFDSRSTLGARPSTSSRTKSSSTVPKSKENTAPSSFFSRFRKGSTSSKSSSKSSPQQSDQRIRALRSVGSLKSKSKPPSLASVSTASIDPGFVPSKPSCDLGPEAMKWLMAQDAVNGSSNSPSGSTVDISITPGGSVNEPSSRRQGGRRSISYSASSAASMPSLPSTSHSSSTLNLHPPTSPSGFTTPSPTTPTTPSADFPASSAYQASLANALIAASHAEASKGVHSDLLQILNHSGRQWGFSYSTYPHAVRVWYGDRDEKIAENAVRWMERTMGPDTCRVKVVKGADHALMYNSAVVIEAMEHVRDAWK